MDKKSSAYGTDFLSRLFKSVWLFPTILTIVLIAFTALRISGSSVGAFHELLYGNHSKDPNLVLNHPRPIRSDEWEFNTPMIVSQSHNGFQRSNPYVGQGEDMSVVVDVPYKDWSEFFRPTNWGFFFLPLEYAFALKWWLMGYLLIISCYFFCLHLLPGKRLAASVIALSLFFSPFVQWWYQISTLGPIFLGLFISLVAMRLIDGYDSKKFRIFFMLLLTYLLTWFGLILYPPFQIPCAIVTTFFIIGYLLNRRSGNKDKRFLLKLGYIAVAVFVSLVLFLMFVKTRGAVVSAVENTVYPGHRIAQSGGFDLRSFFSSQLSMQLQWISHASHYLGNQSESSNFILIAPFLLIPSFYLLIIQWRRKHHFDWPLFMINLLLIILLVRIFVPILDPIYKLAQLQRVPNARLLIGFGLLGFIQLILILSRLAKFSIHRYVIWVTTGITFIISIVAALDTRHLYPLFVDSLLKILLLSIAVSSIVFLVQKRETAIYGISLLLFLSIISSAVINPLYRGLAPLTSSDLATTIRGMNYLQSRWIVADSLPFENYALANGLHSLSGVYSYPQKQIWQSISQTPPNKNIYNRFAHAVFITDSSVHQPQLSLEQPDTFKIHFNPCSNFLKEQDVHFIMTPVRQLDDKCLKVVKTLPYPNLTFYIYRVL